MKNKLLKILTLIFALCMVVSVATACGGGNDQPQHIHDYKTIKFDQTNHWFECDCKAKSSLTPHNIVNNACVCGYVIQEEHVHEYNTLKYDNESHWFECDCGAKKDIENHKGGTATCTQKAICSICGQEYGEKAPSEGLEYMLINDDTEYEVKRIGSCNDINIVIPSTYLGKLVTSIGERAFFNCDSLQSIDIPDSVTSIGERAFFYCDSLQSIDIPDSVTSIGDEAFYWCDSLQSVEIGNGVTSIGAWVFFNCDSLQSVEIGNSVTSIGALAFSGCDSLQSIEVDSANEYYKSTDGNLYSKDGKTLIQYAPGKTATSFTIPNSVTSIGDCAFTYCSALTSIGIPDSVSSIGNDAFSGCYSLTSIDIPDSVTSIGDYAFEYCDSLTYNIKDGLKYLGNNINPYLYLAGVVSKDITAATIDNNCRLIGDYAFSRCDSLQSVEIGNSVTSIGDYAFHSCESLTSIDIPDSVTSIGESAFFYCDSLQSITYNGTKEEWMAIEKGDGWNYDISTNKVQCIDGDVYIY